MNIKLCIAASGEQQLELTEKEVRSTVAIQWVKNTEDMLNTAADFYIDCTFTGTQLPETDRPLLIHSPAHTLSDMRSTGRVARFCAWNTFLKRNIWEVAVADYENGDWLRTILNNIGWHFFITKDEPGLIAPRIVSAVISEAYCALQEGISSKKEIDVAMKSGTNYPYGPFEWSEKIGILFIKDLLQKLSKKKGFYFPAVTEGL